MRDKGEGEAVKDVDAQSTPRDTDAQTDIVRSIEEDATRGERIELVEGVTVIPRSDGTLDVGIEDPELLVDIYFSGRDENGQAIPKEWGCTMNALTRSIAVPQKFRGPGVRTMAIVTTALPGDANSQYAEWHEIAFPERIQN
jgi:hypothetical protein